MKKVNTLLLCVASVALVFHSCKKEHGTSTCSDLQNDQILMDGTVYVFAPQQATNCATVTMNGATWYTHFRSVNDGKEHTPGVSFNQPDINITLSSVPAAGATVSYTLDNGSWQTGGSPAPAGKATFRMNNYYDTENQQQQYWFSDAESGTIQATADTDGKISLNFTDVKLVRSGGSLSDRKTVCGKNIICH